MTIDIKLTQATKKFTERIHENPYVRWEIIGYEEDDPNTLLTYAYFQHFKEKSCTNSDELTPCKDMVVRGRPARKGKYQDLRDLTLLTDFGGVPVPPDEWEHKETHDTDRMPSILAQSDLHAAAPIVAILLDKRGATFSDAVKDLLIEVALVCREARLELTKKYQENGEKNNED